MATDYFGDAVVVPYCGKWFYAVLAHSELGFMKIRAVKRGNGSIYWYLRLELADIRPPVYNTTDYEHVHILYLDEWRVGYQETKPRVSSDIHDAIKEATRLIESVTQLAQG